MDLGRRGSGGGGGTVFSSGLLWVTCVISLPEEPQTLSACLREDSSFCLKVLEAIRGGAADGFFRCCQSLQLSYQLISPLVAEELQPGATESLIIKF